MPTSSSIGWDRCYLKYEILKSEDCLVDGVGWFEIGKYTLAPKSTYEDHIEEFDKKIKGYSNADAILLGVESRTSSPVRIIRDDNGVSSIKGIYPCGEGAGYAGGITTAAIDGIKVAESIIKEYSN